MKRLIELRKERGLTQTQLGEAIGVSLRTIRNWEKGEAEPSLVKGIEVAKFFDVEVEELLSQPQEAELV